MNHPLSWTLLRWGCQRPEIEREFRALQPEFVPSARKVLHRRLVLDKQALFPEERSVPEPLVGRLSSGGVLHRFLSSLCARR